MPGSVQQSKCQIYQNVHAESRMQNHQNLSRSADVPQALRKQEHWREVETSMRQHTQKVWRDEQLPVPDSWQIITNGSTTALRSLQLRMPNSRYNRALHTCIHSVCIVLYVKPAMFAVLQRIWKNLSQAWQIQN